MTSTPERTWRCFNNRMTITLPTLQDKQGVQYMVTGEGSDIVQQQQQQQQQQQNGITTVTTNVTQQYVQVSSDFGLFSQKIVGMSVENNLVGACSKQRPRQQHDQNCRHPRSKTWRLRCQGGRRCFEFLLFSTLRLFSGGRLPCLQFTHPWSGGRPAKTTGNTNTKKLQRQGPAKTTVNPETKNYKDKDLQRRR